MTNFTSAQIDLINRCLSWADDKARRSFETDLIELWEDDPYFVFERFLENDLNDSGLDFPSKSEVIQMIEDEELYFIV